MSLLLKSGQNETAIIRLKEFNLYSPAIHCCYYSCFQKILFILKDYFPDEYATIPQNRRGSHSSLLAEFKFCYRDHINRNNAIQIDRRVTQLKALRIRSDYRDELISEAIMEQAEKYTKEILQFIKQDTQL